MIEPHLSHASQIIPRVDFGCGGLWVCLRLCLAVDAQVLLCLAHGARPLNCNRVVPTSFRPAMVRIHPLTLRFDDDDVEKELRAGTLNAAHCALILFGILDTLCRVASPVGRAMLDPASDTILMIVYTCIAITYATLLALLHHERRLPPDDAARFVDRWWMYLWVINVAVWWAMQYCGLARRLTRAEGQEAAMCCAMWAFVMVLQHALFVGYQSRIIVMLLASSIALTSVEWRTEMLTALMFGEAIGYSIEHMARISYLPRAKILEDMRVAKERSDYDLQMLAHSRAQSRCAMSPMRGHENSACSKSNSARSKSNGVRSKSNSVRSRSNSVASASDASFGSSLAELSGYGLGQRTPSATEATSDQSPRPASGRERRDSWVGRQASSPSPRPALAASMMRREVKLRQAGAKARAREQVLWDTLDELGLLQPDDTQSDDALDGASD